MLGRDAGHKTWLSWSPQSKVILGQYSFAPQKTYAESDVVSIDSGFFMSYTPCSNKQSVCLLKERGITMARIVNEAAHTAKRNAILDAAQRAVATKGYEQMAIADLLSELQMSSGAFYHYFDSKPALLAALIEHIGDQLEPLVLPIVQDPISNALDKLERFFATLNNLKLANKDLVLSYLRIWYADENAIVRNKLYVARVKRFTPWLEEIIRQGIEEAVLTTPYPDQAARLVLSLLEGLGYATVGLLLAEESSPDDLLRLERITAGTTDALERVLGAPTGFLQPISHQELAEWLAMPALKDKEQES
jgi:AcrR family transcriptional regulator